MLWANPAFAVTQWCDDANAEACFNIETGSGETLDDQSSNNNDGTFKGAGEPAWEGTRLPDAGDGFNGTTTYSVDFDGANDYVTVSTVNIGAAGTILFWGYPEFTVGDGTARYIFDSTNNDRYLLYHRAAGAGWGLYLDSTAIWDGAATLDGLMDSNAWTHVAVVFENSGPTQIVYKDGVSHDTAAVAFTGSNPATLYIGERYSGANYWDGNIDEFLILSTDSSSTNVNDIMDNGLVQAAAGRTRRFF